MDFIIIVKFSIFCDPPEDDCRSHHELWIISYFNSGFLSKLWYINHIFYTFLAQTLLGELLDRGVSSCEEPNIPLVPTLENNIKSYIYIPSQSVWFSRALVSSFCFPHEAATQKLLYHLSWVNKSTRKMDFDVWGVQAIFSTYLTWKIYMQEVPLPPWWPKLN